MVILYRGYLMDNNPETVIDYAEGTDWVKLVTENGYMIEPYYRIFETDEHTKYIDFGNWSVFVKIVE